MMRLSLLILVSGVLLLSGCKNEGPVLTELEQFNVDTDLIDNWIVDNGITGTLKHPSLIVYTINEKGTGTVAPRLSDRVTVAYEGRFLESGAVFDSSPGLTLLLGNTIRGWRLMVPEMREGDKFTIYLQSLYGYGPGGTSGIPPNSVLVFDIELIRIEG